MERLARDLRHALRRFRAAPGPTGAAVVTIALGLAATTAVFAVVNAVLIRPLPFPEPDRLVALWESNPERGWLRATASPANFLDWRERSRSLDDITVHADWVETFALTGEGEPEMLRGTYVFGNFFSVLGVRPLLGRGFREEEGWEGRDDVAVLDHGLWMRRFGGDPEVVGRDLTLQGRRRTVVGVMPPGFDFPGEETELWVPFGWDPEARAATWFRRAHFVRPIGRLRTGAGVEEARAELGAIAARLEREHPETNRLMGAGLGPLQEWVVGDTDGWLLLLLGAVGLLLLVACANVAGLLLARNAARARELAVRTALGAGRSRLAAQLLAEALLLWAAGGAAGVALGLWGAEVLVALAPGDLPPGTDVSADPRVLGFAALATLGTGIAFALLPALRAAGAGPARALRAAGRGSVSARGSSRARRRLVIGQVALAVVLVVGAGLMVRTLDRLRSVDPGFAPGGVAAATVSLPGTRYDTPEGVVAFWRSFLERARGLPGIEAAALTDALPLTGDQWTSDFSIEGRPPGEYGVDFHRRRASPGYFRALGVPLLRGRDFTPADDADAPAVAIVNETFARRYFADEDPLGRRLAFDRVPDSTSVWRTVVGVVGDEKRARLSEAGRTEVFVPFAQVPQTEMHLVFAGAGDPLRAVPGLRSALGDLDAALPLYGIRRMEELVAASVERERFLGLVLGSFALVALVLAAVGLYGVISFSVLRRRREIGLRLAVGARPSAVLALVLREGTALVAAGLLLGIGAAAAGGRLLSSLLYETSPTDPLTYLAVAGCLAATGLAATIAPARRAARTDPMSVLREE